MIGMFFRANYTQSCTNRSFQSQQYQYYNGYHKVHKGRWQSDNGDCPYWSTQKVTFVASLQTILRLINESIRWNWRLECNQKGDEKAAFQQPHGNGRGLSLPHSIPPDILLPPEQQPHPTFTVEQQYSSPTQYLHLQPHPRFHGG